MKNQRGVSMIMLVIMIIVIIVLSTIIFSSKDSINEAGEAKFLQELSEVRKGITTIQGINSKQGRDEKTVNKGFIKVNINNAPESFVSYTDDGITGYVVDLSVIDYQKSSKGQGYLDIIQGDTISFDEDDVYIYDAIGNVYYAKGFVLESGKSYYAEEEVEKKNPPMVNIVDTTGGNIVVKVTPAYNGNVIVTIGGKKANTSDGETFTLNVTENGTYILIAEEENGSSTRTTVSVSDITKEISPLSVITNVRINNGEGYTNDLSGQATMYITAENTEYISVMVNTLAVPDVNDSAKWRKYSNTMTITLNDGLNRYYIWGKNDENRCSNSAGVAEITLDKTVPTREEPTYVVNGFEMTVTCKQTDALPLDVMFGYKTLSQNEFVWQESNVITDIVPGEKYILTTKATDRAGNTSISREKLTVAIQELPGGVTIVPSSTEWSKSVDVLITYPDNMYQNIYRINDGDWRVVTASQTRVKLIANSVVEAGVSISKNANEREIGEITRLDVNWIDRVKPAIYEINTGSGDPTQEGYYVTAKIRDDESGIVAWTVTGVNEEPTTWTNEITKTKEEQTISIFVNDNKPYFIWAKDQTNQATMANFIIQNIDKTDPVIKTYNLSYEQSMATIDVVAQDIALGLNGYAVTRGENVSPTESDWVEITKTIQEYNISYEVRDGDTYNVWVRDVSGRKKSVSQNIRVRYNVTYDYATNGGTSIDIPNNVVEFGCNTNIDLTPISSRSGYIFVGWNTDPNATDALREFVIGTEDVTVYAIFKRAISVTIQYYDVDRLVTDNIERFLYNGEEEGVITVPNVTAEYTGYIKEGWTEDISNNATVKYSGENIEITTSGDVNLYMMYRKNISATYRYYSYVIEDTEAAAREHMDYLPFQEDGITKYRCYDQKNEILYGRIRTNSYNIASTTTASITSPSIQTTIPKSSVWVLRGWSQSSESDGAISHANNEVVNININKTYYASYASEINAYKYKYGVSTPYETLTVNATMSYNAQIKSARVLLSAAATENISGQVWTAEGWCKNSGTDIRVDIVNEAYDEILVDTSYYAIYVRDISVTEIAYGLVTNVHSGRVYLNVGGINKKAEITMSNLNNVDFNGQTWQPRGFSTSELPNATTTLQQGEMFLTDVSATYYVSYYTNLTITTKILNGTSNKGAIAYLGYDSAIHGATVTLGTITQEHYDEDIWTGIGWTKDNTQTIGDLIEINSTETVSTSTTYYAMYERNVSVTKNTYNNQTEVITAVARLNASGVVGDAIIPVGTAEDVMLSSTLWTQYKWSTTPGTNDQSATLINQNSNMQTHKDSNIYAIYMSGIRARVHYYENGIKYTDIDIGSRMNYIGNIVAQETKYMPAIASVTKDGKTWNGVGYLSSTNGYTLADKEGQVTYVGGEEISITTQTEYYAIYATTITLTKVEMFQTNQTNYAIKMNSLGEELGYTFKLGTISDVSLEGKVWVGIGWNTNGNIPTSLPEVSQNQDITILNSIEYYALYNREIIVELNEYKDGITTNKKTQSSSIYMSQDGTMTSTTIVISSPTNQTLTAQGTTWNFKGWSALQNSSTITAMAGATLNLQDDTILYAVYSKIAEAILYKYDNTVQNTLSGDAYMDVMGRVKKANILLDGIESIEIEGKAWNPRCWSTGIAGNAGLGRVEPGATASIYIDTTYYASYTKDITVGFYLLQTTEDNIIVQDKTATAYVNYQGEIINATISAPTQANVGRWIADGYTESTENPSIAINGILYGGTMDVIEGKTLYGLYHDDVIITYNANGGTPTPATTSGIARYKAGTEGIKEDALITITTTNIVKTGGIFNGAWGESPTSTEAYAINGEEKIVEIDKTLYAIFEPRTYNVDYANNILSRQIKTHGIPLTIHEEEPEMEGFTFKGWTLSESSTTVIYSPGSTYIANEPITLYPVWEAWPD